ncbi:MAG: RNA methyltransferase [Desulfobacterales bacterium]|nr:RNA methyltransferase [Desulfobacterales bacterium]MCP4164070.1 RNA methyltransferase [Deltaproteobacteria bacterium]
MARLKQQYEGNGFYGIGILNNANEFNVGTLWRTAYILGAAFIFTVTKKYKPQSSDVTKAWTKIPLFHYRTIDELKWNLPHSTKLIGVEMTKESIPLIQFKHPIRGVYLLGNEKIGLSENILDECESVVSLPGDSSLNVAVAGSILMYDRVSKIEI